MVNVERCVRHTSPSSCTMSGGGRIGRKFLDGVSREDGYLVSLLAAQGELGLTYQFVSSCSVKGSMQEGRWAVIFAQSTLTGNVVPARGTPRKGGLKEIR